MATTKSPYKIASKTLSSGINKVSGAMAAAKKKADEAAAAKKKAAEEAARKKAAAAKAARKKAAESKIKSFTEGAKKGKAAAASEPIKMSIKPSSGMTVSASPKPTVENTINTLSKVGEMQKTLDKAAMSGMDEGKVSMKRGGAMKKKKMRTGGMVNSNSKVSASTVARGTVGGKSKAPKTAIPKAMYGKIMKRGGSKK